MMELILELTLFVLGMILGATFSYFVIKATKNIEKYFRIIVFFVVFIAIIIPIIFFILDIYDIPSILDYKYIRNVDMNNWFSFFTTFFTSFVSAIISGLILIWIMFKQTKEQIKNFKNDKRIENAPLLKYHIENESIKTNNRYFITNSKGKLYHIFFGIENIGLNHAKRVEIILYSEQDNLERIFKITDEQSILKKDEIYWFDFIFNCEKNSLVKKLDMKISYTDMLNNKYEQEIVLEYEITDTIRIENKGLVVHFSKIEIKDEKLSIGDKKC